MNHRNAPGLAALAVSCLLLWPAMSNGAGITATVDTVFELATQTGSSGQSVIVLGHSSVGGEGGGVFYWTTC